MQLPLTGGCQCGQIRYEITEQPSLVYACHCSDCQRITSSAFSLGGRCRRPLSVSLLVNRGRFNASLTAVGSTLGSYALIVRAGCTSQPRGGVVRVRAGRLDDTSWLRPTRHIWTSSKQPWVAFAEVDELFEGSRPSEPDLVARLVNEIPRCTPRVFGGTSRGSSVSDGSGNGADLLGVSDILAGSNPAMTKKELATWPGK
jgi:hypothetical protein